MEKYHRDDTYTVLNKNESIAHVQRIFRHRASKSKSKAKDYEKNGEKIRQKQREDHAKNPEKKNKREREYHAKNPEKKNKKAREYHAKNKDTINKKRREEYAENPEPALQRSHDHYQKNKETIKQRHSEYREKNRDVINEKKRAKRRKDRAAASSDTAKMMRQLSEEYNARAAKGEDIIRAEDLLEPPIEVEIRNDKNDHPVVYYKTPTNEDPYKVNDANVLTRLGIGKGNKWVKPARIHATHVPLEKMQLTDNKMMVVSNEMITKQTQTSCDLRMFGKWNHSKHSKWYSGIGMKNSIKFILRHWKNCWRDGELIELFLHVYFPTNKVYDSCFQVRGDNDGGIPPSCALLSGSIIMGEACAVIKATLGEDRRTLSDTTFKFIRINRDMNTVVDLPLNDDSLIVTPFEVTTKPSEEVNEGAVAWDASRESEAEDFTEEEIWERYEREHGTFHK